MKKKSIITVISIIVIIISLIGIRYAYSIMIPEVKEENLSQSVIRAKKLGLVFDDKTLVNCESLFPGITVTKEFDVTSKSDDELTYNVKFVNVTNDYGTDVVYKLYKNNELVVEETPLPKTKDLEYVYTSISIKPGEKHEYRMEITYLNLEDKLQKVDRTAEFHGTIEIDAEKNIDVQLPIITFVTNGNSTYEKEQGTVINVADDSVDGMILKYIWTTSETQPTESEFILTFENGQSITKNTGNGIWYLWILAQDEFGNTTIQRSEAFYLDNEKPTCTITGNPTSWQKNAKLIVSGNDELSDLGTNAYSWDGTTYSATNSKSVTANGTYTAYVKDNAGNIETCKAVVSKVDNISPIVTCTVSGNKISAKCSDSVSGCVDYTEHTAYSTRYPRASAFDTSNNSPLFTNTELVPTSKTISWSFDWTGAKYEVYMSFYDAAGNVGSCSGIVSN